MLRLDYALNPLLPCRSPILTDLPVARLEELLPALDTAASRLGRRPDQPIDRDMTAFIAARTNGRLDNDLATLGDVADPAAAVLSQLGVLAHLQARMQAPPLPGLAGWLAGAAGASLDGWHNREALAARRQALSEAVPAGDLMALLKLLDDPAARSVDAEGHAAALHELRRLDSGIAQRLGSSGTRSDAALRLGQEVSAVLGLAALVAAIVAVAFG